MRPSITRWTCSALTATLATAAFTAPFALKAGQARAFTARGAEISGRVTRVDCHPRTGGKTRPSPRVAYAFTVQGAPIHGEDLLPTELGACATVPPGTPVTVTYLADDPEVNHVGARAVRDDPAGAALFAALIAALFLIVLFGAHAILTAAARRTLTGATGKGVRGLRE